MKRTNEEPVVGDADESRKKPRSDDLHGKIKKQIEFYFGDSNYPKDKFMNETAEKNEGWIPVPTLFLFKRLASMTTDATVLYEACKDSTVVVFDETKTKVKRATEVDASTLATYKARSIEVYKLQDDATMEQLEEFFATYGKVLSVRLLNRQGKFMNGARVEFATEEEAKKVCENAELELNGQKIKIVKSSEKEKKEKTKRVQTPQAEVKYVQGTVLQVTNIPNSQSANRAELKQTLSKFGKVLFVDNSSSETVILARFLEPAGVQDALKEIEAKNVKFEGTVLEGSTMPAAEEEEYWKNKVLPGLAKKPTHHRGHHHRR
eukprot:TRINITY_DN12816_c0_g1_i1.p1 TRINITY_DN12816_c0_g1~~TRINITY_DN12816_c0_g1_i1.p1  ORF type:complete len:339 (+),score=112.80 TRINITY_DN12816_c0_g1_i1:60-1019(+)